MLYRNEFKGYKVGKRELAMGQNIWIRIFLFFFFSNLSYAANSFTKYSMRAQFCQGFLQLNRKYTAMHACDLSI